VREAQRLVDVALEAGVSLVWSPLGWGRLTGKLRRGAPLPELSRLHKTAGAAPDALAPQPTLAPGSSRICI
jgi:aryl-alcohol dehydrogenase-like predicted oxidoreductase